jgi:hypothetical protein
MNGWLQQIREREQSGVARYRGLAAAWHVVRLDYGAVFIVFFLAVLLSVIYVSANPGGRFPSDDSYVTLAAARSFVLRTGDRGRETGGVRPSPVSRLPSPSAASPLQVYLIVLLARLTRSVSVAVILLGTVALGIAGIMAYYWSKAVTGDRRISTLSATLLVSSGWMIFDALSGRETMLFIMLVLIGLYLFERKSCWFGIPLALAVMTNPCGWFFAAGLGIYALAEGRLRSSKARESSRVQKLKPPIGFLLFIAGLAIFLALTRARITSLLPSGLLAGACFSGEIGLPLGEKLRIFGNGVRLFYTNLALPLTLLIVLGLAFARRTWRRCYIVLSAVFFYLACLAVFPGSLSDHWCRSQHIFIPFLMLAIAEGSFALVRRLPCNRRRTVIIAGLVILLTGNQLTSIIERRSTYVNSLRSMEATGEALAIYLVRQTRPGDRIAAVDVGLLSLIRRRQVIDLTGQVNPDAARLYRYPGTLREVAPSDRKVLDYVLASNSRFLVITSDDKRVLNFDPDQLPQDFAFMGETKPVYPNRFGGYRIYRME